MAMLKMYLTDDETVILKTILYAEMKRLNDLADHAAAHGQELYLPHQNHLADVIAKIDVVTRHNAG